MAKKIFKYHGKTLEELNEMPLEEFKKLLPSKQRRKLTRGLSEKEKHFLKRLKSKDGIKTHLRDMIVLPEMVGKTIKIHNGKAYETVMLQPETIGLYLGELSLTRRRLLHSAPGVGATRSSSAASVR